MIQNYRKELIIKNFIYNKINQGYTVKKISDDEYEFKITIKRIDISEKIHSETFLTDFINKENEYPIPEGYKILKSLHIF